MSVEDVLRATLRAAPEPPDGLGAAHTARRRAKAIKRRRYAAVTSAVTCVALVLAGVTLAGPSRRAADDATPVGPPPAGTYPDWPRRGDATPAVEAEALVAYDEHLAEHASGAVRGPVRVLYAERDGDDAVVVLHAVASEGGERLVVLTGTVTGLRVYLDTPAPEPATRAVTVVLDREEHAVGNVCERGAGPVPEVRLLVLAAPGGPTEVEWHASPPGQCRNRDAWTRGELSVGADGTLLTPVPVPKAAYVAIGLSPGPNLPSFHHDRPEQAPYVEEFSTVAPHSGPVPWTGREDVSRAMRLRNALWGVDGALQRRYGGHDCLTLAAVSLPDGTPFVLCALRDVREPLVLLVTESHDRENRVYLEVPPDPLPTAFTAVVDGLTGRWLLVVGDEGVAAAELRSADGVQQVPMKQGVGWLRLDREPPDDARVWTPGYGADGGMAIMDRTGEVIDLR